jgi:hypothetical protein
LRDLRNVMLATSVALSAALLSTTVLMPSSTAFAQAQPAPQPVEIEGEIQGFRTLNAGTTQEVKQLKVMGVWVNILAATSITSVSGDLTIADLMSIKPIPGFDKGPGFIGGTGIVTGTSDQFGNVMAETIFADTAENVLLGTVRNNIGTGDNTTFDIEGSPVVLLPSSATGDSYPPMPKNANGTHPLFDARYKGKPLMNAYGFAIEPSTIPVGTFIAAEGYLSKSLGKFLAFSIEADAGELVNKDSPAISIQRAQCRERDANTIDLEVRGSIYNPTVTPPTAGATGAVGIFKPATAKGAANTNYGTEQAVADVDQFGIYDFDARIATTQGCPLKVRAQYAVNGRTYMAPMTDVEIRID